MATVINNPAPANSERPSYGLIAGLIIAVLLVVLVVAYGSTLFSRGGAAVPETPSQIQQMQPPANNSGESSGTDVNIPDQIDVNLNQNPQ